MARRPVWDAMADLFLDTDFKGMEIEARLVERIAASPFGLSELDQIYAWEVAPAFAFNLRGIAGEWGMWEEGEAERRIRAILPLPRWRRACKRCCFGTDWPRWRSLVAKTRAAS